MLWSCISLAKVMTQANENDLHADQVRRGPGNSATYPREPPGPAAAGRAGRARAGARALRHSVRRSGDLGEARRDEPRRAGRARASAAPLDDPGYRRVAGVAAGHADRARLGPEAGRADRDPGRPGTAGQIS